MNFNEEKNITCVRTRVSSRLLNKLGPVVGVTGGLLGKRATDSLDSS